MYNTTKEQRLEAAINDLRALANDIADEGTKIAYQDSQDLMYIAFQLKTGHMEYAVRLTRNLDTAVRDTLPPICWEFVGLTALPHYEPTHQKELEKRCALI